MAKKLTAAFVKTVTEPGKYGDQYGLILRVLPSGAKQWIWRGTVHGRRRDLGLGGFPYVSLAEARQLAFDYRKLARGGGDPSALRRGRAVPTFEQALEEVLAIHRGSWRDGGKSEQQWRASPRDYAIPQLGRRPVDAITTADVMAVLTPIWNEKRVTAQRVRGWRPVCALRRVTAPRSERTRLGCLLLGEKAFRHPAASRPAQRPGAVQFQAAAAMVASLTTCVASVSTCRSKSIGSCSTSIAVTTISHSRLRTR